MSETHLDLDALADLLVGEGSQADVDHVADCAVCAGRLGELADAEQQVAAALAALPAPPVPNGLAERIDAAVAAEPALRPAPAAARPVTGDAGPEPTPEPAPRAPSGTVTPFPHARTERRRWLPAAAAGLVLLAGAGIGAAVLSDGSGGAGDTAAGGAAESAPGFPRSETGTDYGRDAGALAEALPDLLSGEAPRALLSAPQGDDSSASDATSLARLHDPEGLASCLAELLPPDDDSVRPLAVDYARYDGQPALVVVLPATDPTKVDVFVVGAGCSLGNDQTLFFTRLDRP